VKTVMPPPKTGKTVTTQQIATLKAWIEQGAEYKGHWAFTPPVKAKPPGNVPHVVDDFIRDRLKTTPLKPSAPADKLTLLRRVTLDLTGLPPTPAEVDAFLKDTKPGAYERVVDRLLASPRYGERMALDWLDAARYADTHGYHIDSARDQTRWRDYVIKAFNDNMPFDQFTIEQFAGDLLPNATIEQKIATGFHRNHMINFEGGAIPEEYHAAYLVDRVNTMGTVWLGLTVGCAQCHDHKYDPLTQKDYYRLVAFFNNVPEKGLDGSKGNAVPVLKLPDAKQQTMLKQLESRVSEAERTKEAVVAMKKTMAATGGAAWALELSRADRRITTARNALTLFEATIPSIMVMEDKPGIRDTFVLERGQYNKKTEKVTADTPRFLPPMSGANPPDRLKLARWLVGQSNPLTSRVLANRLWQLLFGTGLVKTAEDFGTQGEWPTHPELLDWLACELRDRGWNIKAMMKLLVTSETYKQASVSTPLHLQHDPENRLLARQTRLRLQAETLRDQALFVAGLLDDRIGGASVSPYQPPGIWEELASREDYKKFSAQVYEQSKGRDLYRRGMYTFWKRTAPPPTMIALDAPDRETCTVRRSRTNTPLQALVLMNDPTFVEAARKLAERVLKEGGTSDPERIDWLLRTTAGRGVSEPEQKILTKLLSEQRKAFQADLKRAEKLLKVGESLADASLATAELAAWATFCLTVMNLDEVVTRN
jgi:hypothetical protein